MSKYVVLELTYHSRTHERPIAMPVGHYLYMLEAKHLANDLFNVIAGRGTMILGYAVMDLDSGIITHKFGRVFDNEIEYP